MALSLYENYAVAILSFFGVFIYIPFYAPMHQESNKDRKIIEFDCTIS